jgi:hypothetical protein
MDELKKIILKLKENGCSGIKVSFEDEGALFNEIVTGCNDPTLDPLPGIVVSMISFSCFCIISFSSNKTFFSSNRSFSEIDRCFEKQIEQ